MADKKISALPAATTPLAGTEVLPIVQGGVTDQVSVANLTSGRDVTVKKLNATDNVVIGTAGKGIDFSANTNAAGMTSELLNWYEEGTWTASVTDGTNNATMSASSCRYVRIGRIIFVSGYVAISAKNSLAGAVRISGLPFTCANANAAYAGGGVTYGSGLNLVAGQSVTAVPELNTTYLQLYVWAGTGGTTPMQATQWTDTGGVMISAIYSV